MINKNIQMKKREGNQWHNLFPHTLNENVFDNEGVRLTDNLKNINDELDEVDTTLINLKNKDSQLQNELTLLHQYNHNQHIDVTQAPWNVPNNSNEDVSDLIQNVLTNAPPRTTLYFPKGNYLCEKPLVLEKELTLKGVTAGENGGTVFEFKVPTGENLHALWLKQSAKNSNIQNIYLKNSSLPSIELHGIGNTSNDLAVTHLNVADVWAVGFRVGFSFRNIYLSRFDRCYAVRGYTGFSFLGHSTSLIFNGCYANVNTDGYVFDGVVYSTLISCATDDNERYGYRFNNCEAFSIIGAGAEKAKVLALYFDKNNSGCTVNGFFSHICGETASSMATTLQVEGSNVGISLNGITERNVHEDNTRSNSIILGASKNTTLNGYDTVKPIYVTPVVTVNGLKKSTVQPASGDFLQGDVVMNQAFNGTGTYQWVCTASGNPGTWKPITI